MLRVSFFERGWLCLRLKERVVRSLACEGDVQESFFCLEYHFRGGHACVLVKLYLTCDGH